MNVLCATYVANFQLFTDSLEINRTQTVWLALDATLRMLFILGEKFEDCRLVKIFLLKKKTISV